MSEFDIAKVIDVERVVNETALRDVYIAGCWDMLGMTHPGMTSNGRIATICKLVGRSDSTVRGVVDAYRKRKEGNC